MPNFPDPTLVAIPAFIVCVALEWWAVKTRRAAGNYQTKDAIVSMAMGLGSSISGALFGFMAYAATLWVWNSFRLTEIAFTWWSFAGLLIFNDFLYYWKHRAMHRVRWWWANHVVHHSSEHYNLTTALRQPWSGPITGLFVIALPQIVLGFHPAMVAFAGGLNLLYQFWIHTEAIDRTPRWFEYVFNTPSHHRVHHGRNARYLDANYAGILIIWDRMFGTFVPELARDKPDYGLVTPQKSFNPLWIAVHEYWALAKDIAQDGWRIWRWPGRLFAPPGWSPTGDHQTSTEFKRAFLQAHPDERGTAGFRLSGHEPGELEPHKNGLSELSRLG
ncbi:MAG: sterol desaturase family protein [Pseudomonadota bacterium]